MRTRSATSRGGRLIYWSCGRKNVGLPNVALPCPTTLLSGTTRLDIHECVEGLSDPGSSRSVEQNPPLCGRSGVWYFVNNYDAGVPPASFCVVGSWGPPYDPTTYLNP